MRIERIRIGQKRTAIARLTAALGFVCGAVGLEAGLMDHTWRLGSIGWFTGGTLLTLIAVFILLDGAIAFEKTNQT